MNICRIFYEGVFGLKPTDGVFVLWSTLAKYASFLDVVLGSAASVESLPTVSLFSE